MYHADFHTICFVKALKFISFQSHLVLDTAHSVDVTLTAPGSLLCRAYPSTLSCTLKRFRITVSGVAQKLSSPIHLSRLVNTPKTAFQWEEVLHLCLLFANYGALFHFVFSDLKLYINSAFGHYKLVAMVVSVQTTIWSVTFTFKLYRKLEN